MAIRLLSPLQSVVLVPVNSNYSISSIPLYDSVKQKQSYHHQFQSRPTQYFRQVPFPEERPHEEAFLSGYRPGPPFKQFDQSTTGSSYNDLRREGWGPPQQSPAISALALLGFLFFLHLIQNSLQRNKLLTQPGGSSNGTMSMMALLGRGNRMRRKRNLQTVLFTKPTFIPTQPYPQFERLSETNQ